MRFHGLQSIQEAMVALDMNRTFQQEFEQLPPDERGVVLRAQGAFDAMRLILGPEAALKWWDSIGSYNRSMIEACPSEDRQKLV